MSVEQTKSKITARIWQSIAQSGVSVSAIPQDQMTTLVDAIADGVLLAVDDALDEAGLPARQSNLESLGLASEEQTLWQGRPFLSLVTQYVITNQRVRIISGLLGKEREDIELIRIQDIDHKQGVGERALNIGDIFLRSSDPTRPEAVLRNVHDPVAVHELLRQGMLDARQRFRYSVQEEM
jgi:hypothetical protein